MKSSNVKKINEELKKYKKLLEKEADPVKILKYKRLLRELEYRLMQVDIKLSEVEEKFKDSIYKNILIDRYINNLTVSQIGEKYIFSRPSVYRILKKAKDVFEI